MALVTLTDLKILDFADVELLQDNLDILANEMNGSLDDTNVAAAADIDPDKIAGGGAVTQSEITTTGEASRIPKINASSELFCKKMVFYQGAI